VAPLPHRSRPSPAGRFEDPTLVGALVAFAALAAAQVAIPLVDDRAGLTTAAVVAFCATTTCLAARAWGWRRALLGLGSVGALTLLVEAVGTATGVPFGGYEYSGALEPQVAEVPVIVPLAWFAMAVPALAVATRLARTGWAHLAVGAVALTAWDLFLDPQMVDEGYWTWPDGGPYRDIPLSNYAGWLACSLVVMAVLVRVGHGRPAPGPGLLALYSWWAVMQTVGFLLFFDDAVVALVGGLGMGVPAVLAWRAHHRARTGPVGGDGRAGAEGTALGADTLPSRR
jgi:uncharacterized membrane protein